MVIKTLSIPDDMAEFLNDNSDLSPSKMLQSKIIEIREQRRLNNLETKQLQTRLNFMEKKLWEANDEIDKLNLIIKEQHSILAKNKNVKLV